MPESVIVVQRNGGGYVQGARVALGFSNGVTDSIYTDSDGEAVIEHRPGQRLNERTRQKARFF